MPPLFAPRRKLLIAHPERKAQRTLHRLVGSARWPVQIVPDLDALMAAVDADAIAVVDANLARTRPAICAHPARAWIAVPGDGEAAIEPATVEALLATGWTHVLVHPMPLLAEELLPTVLKLIRGDVFGLEKYLLWGADVRSYALDDARDRAAVTAAIAADIAALGLPERTDALAGVIADELLTNALYAAPIDAGGRRFRQRDAREAPRALTGRDAVSIRWGTDARSLAIEVGDRWGSLDDGAAAARFGGSAHAPQDGGMGLALVYACCTQLVIGTVPAALTEVIALLDVRYQPTELGRSTSFHAFRGEA